MADVLIRDLPDDLLQKIDGMASSANQSRQQFLKSYLEKLAATEVEWEPHRHGQGLEAYTTDGGKAKIVSYVESVGGGAANLTQDQMDAYRRARLLADPKNGGKWQEARKILETAGFEVFNV